MKIIKFRFIFYKKLVPVKINDRSANFDPQAKSAHCPFL